MEFLRLLLEDELLSRKDRTAKTLTTKARFRFRADLEDWDYAFHKDVPKAKISELSHLSFFHILENLLIQGKTGVGKTHLAIALGKRLCQEGHATVFLSVNFLFEKIQAAKAAGRYLHYVAVPSPGPKPSSSMTWDLETTPTKRPPPSGTSSRSVTRRVRSSSLPRSNPRVG